MPYYKEAGLDEWMSQDGRITKISELDTPHLLSICALLYRRRDGENGQRNKLVTIEKEIVRRFTLRQHLKR